LQLKRLAQVFFAGLFNAGFIGIYGLQKQLVPA
jgi:hypothetical protein